MAQGLLESGLELMAVGMGTVFVFLTLLVFATRLMSALVLRYTPAPSAPGLQPEEVAAITVAVATYRAQRGQPRSGSDSESGE